mgnify:CR=1 FL=1
MESGENVFRRLDENRERLEVLVAEAHARIEEDEAKHKDKGSRRRKRASIRKPTPPLPVYTSWDHLDIESAVQRRQQQHQKATGNDYSGASSPVPSLMSAEEENPDDHKENTLLDHELGESNDSTGSGAVIAAVAALCQLSSCGA